MNGLVVTDKDPVLTLKLPLSMVNYMLAVLDERPHKESHRVFATITEQATQTIAKVDG